MKTHRYRIYKLTYTIDFPVLLLFFAVFLDIISTSLFVGLNAGTEANPILRELISISIWFIPIYLFFTNAIFVPFLSDTLRKTLSYTFAFVSTLLGANNFSLILFNNAFLIDMIGFNTTVVLFILFGLAIFVYFAKKEKMNKKESITTFSKLLLFLLFLGLVNSLYLAIAWRTFL
ncbi:MAG: hypothetical protein P8Y18_03845 [Candidatus Bathyarchaeota archaeon]